MSNEVLVAIITGVCTLLGTMYTVHIGNTKTQYRIEQLEKKVEKHNSIVERTYKLEGRVDAIENDISRIEK